MVNIAAVFIVVAVAKFTTSESESNYTALVEKINEAQDLWEAKTNEIAAKGPSYIKKLLGAYIPENTNNYTVKNVDVNLRLSIPEKFDARKMWSQCESISSIKDQGRCGSCWAVSVAAAASDRLCIQSNYSIKVNLSAQHLTACCDDCHELGSNGCRGGDPYYGWAFFSRSGMVTGGNYGSKEGCQPYEVEPSDVPVHYEIFTPTCRKRCTNLKYSRSFTEDKYNGTRYYMLRPEDIQHEIMTNGPVVAALHVYEDLILYYRGIYKHTAGRYIGGHAIRLIGWGVENGEEYWLAANSWNTTWGENGFMRILRGEDECGIESYVTAGLCDIPVLPKNETQKNSTSLAVNLQFSQNTLILFNSVILGFYSQSFL